MSNVVINEISVNAVTITSTDVYRDVTIKFYSRVIGGNSESKYVNGLFLDITRATDCVDKEVLLNIFCCVVLGT